MVARTFLKNARYRVVGDSRVKCAVVIAAVIASLQCASLAAAEDDARKSAPANRPGKTAAARAARPLPVAVPEQFAPPQEAYASFPESGAAAAPAKPSACQLRLAKFALFQPLGTLIGPGDCGAADAVQLQTIVLPDQTKIAVTPPAILRCPTAEEIADWVREDVSPSLARFGAPLRGLDNFDSYECRGRNRVRAAALSEHGRADALDVRDFKLADGRELGLTDVNVDKDWRETIRTSACARFSTVLGPGSDGYHEEHIHLDLAERHNGYKVCQWQVREPPPPVEAQAETAPSSDQASAPDEADAPIPLDEVPLPRPRPLAANLPANRAAKKSDHD
jgi:hypothetical protein